MITVLVADDHKLVRRGIMKLLEKEPGIKVIAEAENGQEALQKAREHQPDVILMDLRMPPGIDGLGAIQNLIRTNPDIKILVITVCESDVFPNRLLEEGVAGYVTKDIPPDELIRAIRSVYTGQRYISSRIAQKMALQRYNKKEKSPFDCLSERELQVLIKIASGQKPQDIAKVLHLSPKTINTYRYRLFEKLTVETDVELTLLALRHGLIDND